MKQRDEGLQPKTKPELITVLFEVGETLEMRMIKSLIESMSKGITLVIEKAGERISY
jgi:hypothetical protein